MVRINGKASWLVFPAWADVLIGGESFQRFESLREIIGHQKSVQMFFQVVMSLVVRLLHGGCFEGAVHAFHLAFGPGVVSCGEAVFDTVLLTHTLKDMLEGICIPLAVGKLEAVVGEHRLNGGWHGSIRLRMD
jgi:hypothetical protein